MLVFSIELFINLGLLCSRQEKEPDINKYFYIFVYIYIQCTYTTEKLGTEYEKY